MALVRILVDGDGLLQQWQELAPGKPRFSEVAREELINHLTQYFDISGTPLTTVFDGSDMDSSEDEPIPEADGDEDVTVLYTLPRQAPIQVIHRLIPKFRSQGDLLVVADAPMSLADSSLGGGKICRCLDFVQMVKTAHDDMEREIEKLNQTENQKFSTHG
jgi:predicted RNA-binding protein with PIN domain